LDVEEAWKYYVMMTATQWYFLPAAGGLEDQDEVLLDNIFSIRNSVERMTNPRI
jgi:hypothetical protein